MKKKIFKLMCMLLVVFSLTGCTKYINNDKNKVIKNSSPNREWYAYHTVDGEDLFYSVTSVAEING